MLNVVIAIAVALLLSLGLAATASAQVETGNACSTAGATGIAVARDAGAPLAVCPP